MTTPERLSNASVKQAVDGNDERSQFGNIGCYVGGEWIKTGDAIEG